MKSSNTCNNCVFFKPGKSLDTYGSCNWMNESNIIFPVWLKNMKLHKSWIPVRPDQKHCNTWRGLSK